MLKYYIKHARNFIISIIKIHYYDKFSTNHKLKWTEAHVGIARRVTIGLAAN